MNSKDYIITQITKLQKLGINVCIRYAYEEVTGFHVIEISPESTRRGDDVYMEWEYSVWKEFASLFPDEDLLISNEDETNDMANLIYSYNGYEFTSNSRKTYPSFNVDFGLLCSDENYSLAA